MWITIKPGMLITLFGYQKTVQLFGYGAYLAIGYTGYMLHSKKTLIVIAVLVGLYTIGVNSDTSVSPAKIEIANPDKPKEFDKDLNKSACIKMFDYHAGYMWTTTKWWDKEYTIDQLANATGSYISSMEKIKTDSDLKPYFKDMIGHAKIHQEYMKEYKTLDNQKWFEILNEEGLVYNRAIDYCQKYK